MNWIKKHKIITIILAALLLIVIIGIAASGNKSTSNTKSASNTPTETKKEVSKSEYAVNESATLNNHTLIVSDVQRNYQTGNEYTQPESGKEFIVMTVTISNAGDSEFSFNPNDFEIQDSNGVQQSYSWQVPSEGKLDSGSLAPGGKVSGKLGFEVPAGDANLRLIYSQNLFSDKKITVKL